jgi:hypothetical protein
MTSNISLMDILKLIGNYGGRFSTSDIAREFGIKLPYTIS